MSASPVPPGAPLEALELDRMERDAAGMLVAMPHLGSMHDVLALCAEIRRLRAALEELHGGDGIFYVAQERAMAPGIQREWPEVIPVPPHGRLVRRAPTGEPGTSGGDADA